MLDSAKKLYWHFAASCCLVLFVILGYLVKFYPNTLEGLDGPIANFIRHSQSSGKTTFFTTITNFGNPLTMAFLTCLLAFIFYQKKYLLEAYWLLINTALIAGLGNYLIKFPFARPRPSVVHLVQETHYSFPSGHAMVSCLFYGTLILLLPQFIRSKSWQYICQGLLLILILLIGISRIYVGVHYPTDILGGYLLGSAWLIGTYPTFQKIRFIWRFKGKQL